jgi:hypothetical protein
MDSSPHAQFRYWLYVSEIAMPPAQMEGEIASIVEVARRTNPEHGITGCLLASSRHFAQWVEGPPDRLAVLGDNILRDPRHRAIVTIDEGPLEEPRFPSWTLGYYGPSHLVGRIIARPLQTWLSHKDRGASQLRDLMLRLSQDHDLRAASG